MALTGVVRGRKRPPRIIIYGPPKLGKSTLLSETPKPIFVQSADAGIDNLSCDALPVCRAWADVLANIEQVVKEDHDYQTLAIDTLGGMVELCASAVCQSKFKNDWGRDGFLSYGQGWAATAVEVRRLLPLLDAAVDRGMMVMLTAHTGVQNVKNPLDGDYTKFCPDVGDRRVWAQFCGWADVILRGDFEYNVVFGSKKDEIAKKGGRAEGTTSRILRCSGSAAEDAGCRAGFELPEVMEMSWSALSEALGKDTYTLKEVESRWAMLTKDQQSKTLAWMGVKALKDAPVQKLRQILNRLKTIEVEKASKKESASA